MLTLDFPLYIFFLDMGPGFSSLYFLSRYGPWIFLFVLSFSIWTLDFPLYTFSLDVDPGFSPLYVQYLLSGCLECS
jgi:hypothetical protein